ncbi:MAG: hypothetical protein LBU09_04835, partial [Endomicrobium sp.]|nr:hypothetical protein [Endomicrobium sp.]
KIVTSRVQLLSLSRPSPFFCHDSPRPFAIAATHSFVIAAPHSFAIAAPFFCHCRLHSFAIADPHFFAIASPFFCHCRESGNPR